MTVVCRLGFQRNGCPHSHAQVCMPQDMHRTESCTTAKKTKGPGLIQRILHHCDHRLLREFNVTIICLARKRADWTAEAIDALSMMAPPCNRTLTGARSTSAAEAAKTTTVTKPSLKACMRCQCAHDNTAKTLSVHLQSSSPEHGSTRRTLQGDEGEGDVERGG